jgi:hypothetical protein
MKKITLILALIGITFGVQAQHDHNGHSTDKPATHGMLIFGKEAIYASHLPMFRTPHNYQIILELELTPADKKKFVADQNQNPNFATYTIEPEKFVLPDMVNMPKPFKVKVYRGHFERGGTLILKDITVSIKGIVFNEKFAPEKAKSVATNFILFGTPKEQFMVHQITNKPDFEQIIQVSSTVNFGTEKCALITAQKTENSPIGVSTNDMEMDNKGIKLTVTLLKQLYLEFDDLKN